VSGARLTWLVFRREVREGVRGRTFVVSSAIVLLLLAGVIALPALLGDRAKTVKLGVAGTPPAGLRGALDRAAEPFDQRIELRRYADAEAAREAVSNRKVAAALASGGRTLLVRADPPGTVVAIVGSAVRSLELPRRADRLGISQGQAQALLAPPVALEEVHAAGGGDEDAQFLAFAAAVLLFVALSVYGQAVLTSVVQEKASRIVEVLLATLRPRHLLAGKVAGIGLLGLLQLALVGAAALAAGLAGAVDLPSLGRTAPLALLWFVLGFALYAVAFAAVGALVSRIEDASTAALPVTAVMLVCYLLSFGGMASPDGALATALTLLPVSAPFFVPARTAATAVPAWEQGLAVALTLLAIWAAVRLAGRVYEHGLLRTGARVPFREALRAAVASRP